MSAGGNPVSNLRLTRRRLIAATLGSGLLGMRATAADSIRRLDPVSEAAKDPALLKYVERLKAIVAKRDTPALLALMNPTFRVDFDGGKGPLAFAKHWKPDTPDSAVWKILDRLLSLGGTFYTPTLFAIPYVYTKFPFDLDPFAYVVVTRDQAALRPEADPRSNSDRQAANRDCGHQAGSEGAGPGTAGLDQGGSPQRPAGVRRGRGCL